MGHVGSDATDELYQLSTSNTVPVGEIDHLILGIRTLCTQLDGLRVKKEYQFGGFFCAVTETAELVILSVLRYEGHPLMCRVLTTMLRDPITEFLEFAKIEKNPDFYKDLSPSDKHSVHLMIHRLETILYIASRENGIPHTQRIRLRLDPFL